MHVGGRASGEEHCWYPETIDLPRFCHHPLNLILACEFVVRSFFPRTFDRIHDEPTWLGSLRTAQRCYLSPYYDLQGIRPPNLDKSLLSMLWN